ncbi:MAG: restriction endonuclease S subunit [Glaciecola sp.]|jgi:restriction endonuclease S subunit
MNFDYISDERIYPHQKKWCLNELATIRLGHPFRGTIQPDDKGDVKVVQVRDTDASGEIRHHNFVKTILKTKKEPDWLQNGDILFVAKGAKNYSVLVENIPENTVCSPHFFLIRLKPEHRDSITPEFICWQLNQQPAQRYFKASAEGSKYLSIRRQVLEDVPMKILGLNKQKSITELQRASIEEKHALLALIENRQQQIEAVAANALK